MMSDGMNSNDMDDKLEVRNKCGMLKGHQQLHEMDNIANKCAENKRCDT